MKKLLIIIVLAFASLTSFAQTIKVKGEVVDESGAGVISAGVIEKGKPSNGTVTDLDGKFEITVSQGATLEFSALGYTSQTVTVGKSPIIKVVLLEDRNDLDEAVVIGYGTVKKRDLTGSVATVKSKDIQAFVTASPVEALQGRVPGVVLSQNTGDPAGDYSIRIRGVNSILGDNDPLFIIDGVPQSTSTINTYDVESMEVLKDASATAIYGSRGANGVVIITTKKGRQGRPKVTYDFEGGIAMNIRKLELMDAEEYMKFYNLYTVNTGLAAKEPFSAEDIANANKGVNTDWQDLIFRPAPQQNHNISVSGGTEKISYQVSASAMKKNGLIWNSSYGKYNIRGSLNVKFNDYITLDTKGSYTITDTRNHSDDGGSGGSSLIAAAYSCSPLMYPLDWKGEYMDFRKWDGAEWISHQVANPVNRMLEKQHRAVNDIVNVTGSLNIKLPVGFHWKSSAGIQRSNVRTNNYITSKYIGSTNSASISSSRTTDFITEHILSFDGEWGVHKLNVMAGFTYEMNQYESLSASGSGFLGDVENVYNISAATTINTPSSGFRQWVLMSGLARVNYSVLGRYLFTASFRADGSSRYSPGKKWGFFPSGAFAWNIKEEPWMKGVKDLDILKFRAGYGQTGSAAIKPYSTQSLLESGKVAIGSGLETYYMIGATYPGDLKWETTSQWDLGVDISAFKNRLRITADWYYKLTTDLLNTVYLPWSTGYEKTTRNIGSMSNMGVELLVEGEIVKKQDWGLNIEWNISHNRNRVEKLADGDPFPGSTYNSYGSGYITYVQEGQPLGVFRLYHCTGLDDNGRLGYEDKNGDGNLTDEEDRYIAGSPFPAFTTGLNFGLRYKNWDFNFFLQGSIGGKIYNLSEMRNYHYSQGMNIEKNVYALSWREGQDNTNAWYPEVTTRPSLRYCDRFLEDGSYLRLKNIQLAYNFRFKVNWIQSIRLYVSAQNMLTLTRYSGVDPEVSSKKSDIDSAIDHLSYPGNKSVCIGANFTF